MRTGHPCGVSLTVRRAPQCSSGAFRGSQTCGVRQFLTSIWRRSWTAPESNGILLVVHAMNGPLCKPGDSLTVPVRAGTFQRDRVSGSSDFLYHAVMSDRPRLLDLFCGAGGAGMGYSRAGFAVVGVDIKRQAKYPFEFICADALELLSTSLSTGMICGIWRLADFDAIHASPPCQASTTLRAMWPDREYPELIPPTRALLRQTGLPYVIENVVGASLARAPQLDGTCGVELCGSSWALGVERGYLRRHRLFETTFPVSQPPCRHRGPAVGVYGHGGHSGKHRMLYRAEAAEAMGIDWMTHAEMTQAIPPAYTEHIGRFLMAEIKSRALVSA